MATLCGVLFNTIFCHAQFFDSLQVKTGLETRFSSEKYQPLWLVANRYGTIADRKADIIPYIRVYNKHVLAQQEYANDQGFYDDHDFALSYGLSIYNNNHLGSTIIEEGYAKLEYKNWSLRAGRFEENIDDLDTRLSSGSLGVSRNALPIPKVGIAVTEYTNIPFTGGWLQFKGTFAHGWLGANRYIKNSFYHEKTFFLRVGPGNFKLYGGIQHFVEWGGETGGQQSGNFLKNFWNVVFAKGLDGSNSGADDKVHTGDQRGVLEGGFYWDNEVASLHGYLQKPFEGKNDINPRNKNMLAGVILSFKHKEAGLQKILVEVISTKGIDDHIASAKRESLYNNNFYKTGWEYHNNIIGTPLFINRVRANDYFPEIQPFGWGLQDLTIPGNANIVNNMVFGVHTGVSYSAIDMFSGRTLVTYTRNYGSIQDNQFFSPSKYQFYCLQEISCNINQKNLLLTAGLGYDFGELSNNIGGMLGIEWNIPIHKDPDHFYW